MAKKSFRTHAEKIVALARDNNFTLRETVQHISGPKPTPFVGSPVTVANVMVEWFEQRALDGYNIHVNHPDQFRRLIDEARHPPASGPSRSETPASAIGSPITVHSRSPAGEAARSARWSAQAVAARPQPLHLHHRGWRPAPNWDQAQFLLMKLVIGLAISSRPFVRWR